MLLCNCFQVAAVALELGSSQTRCAVLRWSGGGGDVTSTTNSYVNYSAKSADEEDLTDWEMLQTSPSIQWVPVSICGFFSCKLNSSGPFHGSYATGKIWNSLMYGISRSGSWTDSLNDCFYKAPWKSFFVLSSLNLNFMKQFVLIEMAF